MVLHGKVAMGYGGAGANRSADACTSGREGATVYLAGRTLKERQTTTGSLLAMGGNAHAARADALKNPLLLGARRWWPRQGAKSTSQSMRIQNGQSCCLPCK